MQMTQINDQVAIGPQPTLSQIRDLQQEGYKTLVNFRHADEDEEQPALETESEVARESGMEYLHIPITMKAMSSEAVDKFREKYSQLPKPIFAHCKSGKRAGAMVLIAMSVNEGLTGNQALQRADQMGLGWDTPELRMFVKRYVDRQLMM